MSTLVFLLEENSAKQMLLGIMPRIAPPDLNIQYMTFEGKQDLRRNLVKKIRLWREPQSRFIILQDKDSGDCRRIKNELANLAEDTGKGNFCIVRIACTELESFYLGDLAAVATALQIPKVAEYQNKNPYRVPDNIANAAQELKKITAHKYSKTSGSRKIGECLQTDSSNRSQSYNALLDAIRRQIDELRG